MKKKLFIITLLVLALIMSMFTGCAEKEAEPLRICVDVEYIGVSHGDGVYMDFDAFLQDLKNATGITDVEIEYVPYEGTERSAAVQRIRTEMMSGKGPDVFIVNCAGGKHPDKDEALFPIPEKVMETGVFLPMDEYIPKAQYMEWDKLTSVIVEAGKNWEGQQLIPLTYTFPVLCYPASAGKSVADIPTEWSAMLADPASSEAAAILADGLYDDTEVGGKCIDINIEYLLGKLADYQSEELAFTEEELQQRVKEVFECRETVNGLSAVADADYYEEYMGYRFADQYVAMTGDVFQKEPLTMVPLYSDDGGISASILSFTAINRNTARPEDAFAVVDYLLGKSVQQKSAVYETYLLRENFGIPVHEDLLQQDFPIGSSGRGWSMSDENFKTFAELREQITAVRFQGGLDIQLDELVQEASNRIKAGEEIDSLISDAYETMDLMVGE